MSRRCHGIVLAGCLFSISVAAILVLGAAGAARGQGGDEAGMQVLTRGPVHEAFAKASMTGATAGIIVSKAPPDPVNEIPPDQRPEGGNVAWIPGYWSWDDDRTDFIWESGVWRDLPPGRQWVPGYWTGVQGGWQWISGFWADAAQTEVSYLPPPPEPIEAGPSSPAPGPDHLWSPGCWVWRDPGYAWQAGYWVPQRPEWIWVPAHYTWTPRGYIYVPGYWDHDITHRGMMFAPVYYDRPVYGRPGYAYSPSIVIDLGVVAACLFVQPRTHHYYFGDYYDHRYEERGFYPWYSRELQRYGDDPIYMHYRAEQMRHDRDWDHHVRERFDFRREHVDARPPQTLALQVNIFNARKDKTPEDMHIGRSFAEAAQSRTMPLRLAPVNVEERRQFESRGREVHKFQMDRAKLEMEAAPAEKPREGRGEMRPARMTLPTSPLAAKPVENMPGASMPPPIPVAPRPQAVEGRRLREGGAHNGATTRESTRKEETTTTAPAPLREKPARPEARTTAPMENPKRIGPKPNRIGSPPERIRREPETTNAAPKIETEHVQAQPETKPEIKPEVRQMQRRPETVESPRGQSRRTEIQKLDMTPSQTETKTPAPMSRPETKARKRYAPPGTDNKDKDRKHDER